MSNSVHNLETDLRTDTFERVPRALWSSWVNKLPLHLHLLNLAHKTVLGKEKFELLIVN